jgi:HEAT repeat protein
MLRTALAHAPSDNQLTIAEGLFRCAETLAADGHRDVAIEIYDQLRGLKAAHQVRGGAVRGAILARNQKDGLKVMGEYLRSDDYIVFSAACQTALEMPGAQVTQALTAAVNDLPADNQILVIQTLGNRGEPAALPALSALVRNAAKPVRIAAMRALPQIEQAEGLVLVPYLDDGDADISKAAKESFAAMQGSATDGIVMKMFASNDADKRLAALELMGRRRMTDSMPEVLKAAQKANPRIRPAAIKMLGELGGPAELRTVLDLLTNLEQSADLDAARQALTALAVKSDDSESCAARLIKRLAKAGPAQKVVLLRVLSGIGGTNSLKAVRAAVDDSDARVHTAAIRALSSWQNADAAPILLILASKADNPSDKTLCLRGFLGFASRGDLPANSRLSMCRQAAGLVERDDEKKLLLGALGSINSPNALAMITPYMDDPATREEASTATVAIAERLLKGRNASRVAAKLIEPLEKAAQATANSDLAGRAKALLRQAKKQGGR